MVTDARKGNSSWTQARTRSTSPLLSVPSAEVRTTRSQRAAQPWGIKMWRAKSGLRTFLGENKNKKYPKGGF